MQNELRLVLLVVGMVLVGYILFSSFRQRRQSNPARTYPQFDEKMIENSHRSYPSAATELQTTEYDPLFEDTMGDPEFLEQELANANEEAQTPTAQTSEQNHFMALCITGKMSGQALLSAFQTQHLHINKGIYRCHLNDNPTQTVLFSVASLTEPGIFDRHQMANQSFAGIILWADLANKKHAVSAYERMLAVGRQMASALKGELCNMNRTPLTLQDITHMRLQAREAQKVTPNLIDDVG